MKHVLVIDDDLGISEVIKIILEENNYKVTVISDSVNVLKRITEIQPDMVLLDIWMSGIDGRDVLKSLRSQEETNAIPVVIISALTDTAKIAQEAGADDFLAKPFEITDLLALVKKHTTS